jgi:hypothetical protein
MYICEYSHKIEKLIIDTLIWTKNEPIVILCINQVDKYVYCSNILSSLIIG